MITTSAIGHLGMDSTVNNVNGKNVVNFSLAHTESYKDAQGVKHDKTLWIRCAYWSDKTTIAQYLKKGTQCYVTGQPEVGIYQDKQGKWQAEFKLRVSQIQLLGGKKDESGGSGTQNSGAGHSQQGNSADNYINSNEVTEPLDDLPF